MPLTSAELDKAGLVQFPSIMGGNVPVYNLKDVKAGELKFTGPLLAQIYLGKITKWNDPAIKALNPTAKLTDEAISVVHRSDGSGTTFIWTNYLSKVSPEWKSAAGEGTSVKWPTGVGGKGNEGVASYVQRINGAIGYVEYAYAKQNKLTYGLVKNKDGAYPQPDTTTFAAAAAGADWNKAPGMYLILTDQPGKTSWPITGGTFVLMQKVQDNPANAKEVLKFFDWSFKNGKSMATDLDYVPMPDSVVKIIETNWKNQIKDASGKSVY
jgi:phosphate transport system substrate-binding protein